MSLQAPSRKHGGWCDAADQEMLLTMGDLPLRGWESKREQDRLSAGYEAEKKGIRREFFRVT